MLLRFTSFCFFILLVSGQLIAQKATYLDLINLRNGEKLEGTITHFEPGKLLTIRLQNGKETTLSMDEIKRIGFVPLSKKKVKKEVVFEADDTRLDYTGKFTSHPSIGVNFSTEQNSNPGFLESNRNVVTGYDFSFVEAYNVSAILRTGLGASYTIFNSSRMERVASLYGHVQAAFSKNKFAPYAQIDAGYGLPIGNKITPLIDRQGGILIHPSLGFRFAATSSQPEISLDMGYRFLTTEYNFISLRGIETRTNQYRRFMIRLGTTF